MQKPICILIAIFILVFHTALFAQPYLELDAHYGFGTSELSFNSVPGIGISVYPFKNIGISTGVEYSWRWQEKTTNQSGSGHRTLDDKGDTLIFNYSVKKYKEEWRGRILQIPFLLKYSDDFYYAATGIKIGIPQSARTDISYKGLQTEGYYPEYYLTLTEPEFQGFGVRDGSAKTKISKVKNLFMFAAEGGVKRKLNNNFSMLFGAFADYSLNKGFDRKLSPAIERIQKVGSADIVANDTWKSWQPWSVGVAVKFAFSFLHREEELPPVADTTVYEDPNITILPDSLPPPAYIDGFDPQFEEFIPLSPLPVPSDYVDVSLPLPGFLGHRVADFIFDYPEPRTSPNYSPHNILIAQIAETLRAKPNSQLHCVGYSEKLASEFFAYETALQRALRIRHILSRLYGIDEGSVIVYSRGSNNSGGSNSVSYRRVECFLIDTD